jgi:ribosomal protein S18 acetylase RimI-like enzyme
MRIVFKTIDFTKHKVDFLRFRQMAEIEITGSFVHDPIKIDKYISRCLENLGDDAFLHVYADTQLIGQIELGQKQDFGHIHFFYLLPEFRGQGIFKYMHAKALEIFASKNFSRLQLATSPSNVKAIAVYEKYGWKNIGQYSEKPERIAFEYYLDRV